MNLYDTAATIHGWIISCRTSAQLELTENVVGLFINKERFPCESEIDISLTETDLYSVIDHQKLLLAAKNQEADLVPTLSRYLN